MPTRTTFPSSRSRCALLAALFAASLTGCKSREEQARDEFSEAVSCPASKIEVRELEGVTAHDVREKHNPTAKPKPPADVAADPERLAVWEEKQDKQRRASQREPGFGSDVFEAKGCGETITYECWRKNRSVNFEPLVDCRVIHRDLSKARAKAREED
jgi:hypothetical protein